ncbi:hypothetical protein KXD40_003578 [Peronospora effusa]|uniref:Uncharacterized protein n=1 Tax=Peronospora effusa TaxID=542832 RepID=A0A3M6VJE4_9STRA|nr:hypothetical protein DD238_005495 [Peronospora effusa]RQM09666.1 hypothetical protein DD237_005567 [Peronospora effusa]UIZ22705.1 hypothetical protein KXD40_003578 [Peronospora effusa]CAI5729532.1 unnamed protein product [Peronospora effusa]
MANAAQLSAPAQDDSANVVFATPVPTTFAPTPAPTNFSDPTLTPTAAPTGRAGLTPKKASSNGDDATQLTKSAGTVGTAYSTEGTVGVAYVTTRAEYEAEKNASNDSGSSVTVPIVIIGCLVGVLAVVAAGVARRKRKAVVVEEGNDETNYSNSVHTPVAAKTKNFRAIYTPDAAEHETECFDAINGHGV